MCLRWIIMFKQMLIITTLSYINCEQSALETHQIVYFIRRPEETLTIQLVRCEYQFSLCTIFICH